MDFFNRILTFATNIGVGVERSAIGIEPNPLTDLVDDVGLRFGNTAATIVDYAFDQLIETLGPNLLADVEPITLTPDFDIDNGQEDVETVWLPDDPYILDIGTTQNVGNGEFSRVVLGAIDRDSDDDDMTQILAEHFTGNSGANLDFESQPGIDGVQVVDVTPTEFTLLIEDDTATDRLTFTGPGAEAALAEFSAFIPSPVIAAPQTQQTPFESYGFWNWEPPYTPQPDYDWWWG